MKVATILSFISLGLASAIENRNACHADNCARQVTGTRAGLLPITSRQADCSSYQRVTVTPAPRTITRTAWVAPGATNNKRWIDLEPRQVTVVPSAVPTYAPSCNAVEYASACNCWNITKTTVTARTPRVFETVTTTAGDCTSFAVAAVPTCAFGCLAAAAPQVGCNAFNDIGCLCKPAAVSALYEVVPGCVATACPASAIAAIEAGVSNGCACNAATATVFSTTTTPAASSTTTTTTTTGLPLCRTQ